MSIMMERIGEFILDLIAGFTGIVDDEYNDD